MAKSGYEIVEITRYVIRRWERKKRAGQHELSLNFVTDEIDTLPEAQTVLSNFVKLASAL